MKPEPVTVNVSPPFGDTPAGEIDVTVGATDMNALGC